MVSTALMTLAEVAAVLKVSPRHVRNLMTAGDLVGINIGTGKKSIWRFESVDLDRFIERRRMFDGNLPFPATVKRRRAQKCQLGIDFTAAPPPSPGRAAAVIRARLPPPNGTRRPKI